MANVWVCAIDSKVKNYLSKLFYIYSGLIPLRDKVEPLKLKINQLKDNE